MNFWDIFIQLCKEKKRTPSMVLKELGMSTSSVTDYKNGRFPSQKTLKKFSNYFDVPINVFYTGAVVENNGIIGDSNESNVIQNKTDSVSGEIESEILSLMKKMSTKQKNALLTKAYEISEQQ